MISRVLISDYKVMKDGVVLFESTNKTDANLFLKEIYKFLELNYLKFFKMDHLSKLGFLAAEFLLKEMPKENLEFMNIYLACSSSSLDSDIEYQKTIRDKESYFPSPSVFVYTLPNIVIGEIAIRFGIHGNNSMFIIPPYQKDDFLKTPNHFFQDTTINPQLSGYLDYLGDHYEAEFLLKY